MPIDYSKWDAIELSDDEDFECHPNVDKKSMVRWKQAQVHKERRERGDQRDLLKMEYETNVNFLNFIAEQKQAFAEKENAQVLISLESLAKEIDETFTDPMRKEAQKRMENWPGNWDTPVWGDVLRNHVPWNESIIQVGKSLEEKLRENTSIHLSQEVVKSFDEISAKYLNRQKIIGEEIKRIEALMNKKLTMDHMVTGFDKTMVVKDAKKTSAVPPAADPGSKKSKVVETIHAPAMTSLLPAEAQQEVYEEMESTDDHLIKLNKNLLQFSQASDYGDFHRFLKADPTLLGEKNEEALLLRALCLEICSKAKEARNCVMASLILKFIRNLGIAGIDVFFNKLTGTGTSAQNLFFTDLNTTYDHIKNRGRILLQEKLEKIKEEKTREETRRKIYESFKQPDGTFKLPMSEQPTEMELKQAEWFNNLPEYYKEGLLTEDIDKINQYLGSLSPEDAEREATLAVKAGFIQFQEDESEGTAAETVD